MGFTLDELQNAGYSALQLNKAHFSAKALKGMFPLPDLIKAGYDEFHLTAAGFPATELVKNGLHLEVVQSPKS